MERVEIGQEGHGDRDTQTAEASNTLILEYNLPEPPDRLALEALSPKGDLVAVERGVPFQEEELAVMEGDQAMAGPSYSSCKKGETPQATSPSLVGEGEAAPGVKGGSVGYRDRYQGVVEGPPNKGRYPAANTCGGTGLSASSRGFKRRYTGTGA